MAKKKKNLPSINFSTVIKNLTQEEIEEINKELTTKCNFLFSSEEIEILNSTAFDFARNILRNLPSVKITNNSLSVETMYMVGNEFAKKIQERTDLDPMIVASLVDKWHAIQMHLLDEDPDVPQEIKFQILNFAMNSMNKMVQIENFKLADFFPRLCSTYESLLSKYKPLVATLSSYDLAKKNLMYLKQQVEFGAYKLFYFKGGIIKKEKIIQLLYSLTFSNQAHDVNQNVDNGRGAADFKISIGSSDSVIVEFKLASNSHLKHLEKQIQVYLEANNTTNSLRAIIFFNSSQEKKVNKVLKGLNLLNSSDVIVINASKENKISASKLR